MSRRKARADVGPAGDVFITWKRATVQKFTGRSGDELERWPEMNIDRVLHYMFNEGFLEEDGTTYTACSSCGHSMKFHEPSCTKTQELYGKHIYCTCEGAVTT